MLGYYPKTIIYCWWRFALYEHGASGYYYYFFAVVVVVVVVVDVVVDDDDVDIFIVISTKEILFLPAFVCMLVCLSVGL